MNEGTEQQNLIITNTPRDRNRDDPFITVDNVKVAQFIYLLLNNERDPLCYRHDHVKRGVNPGPLFR